MYLPKSKQKICSHRIFCSFLPRVWRNASSNASVLANVSRLPGGNCRLQRCANVECVSKGRVKDTTHSGVFLHPHPNNRHGYDAGDDDGDLFFWQVKNNLQDTRAWCANEDLAMQTRHLMYNTHHERTMNSSAEHHRFACEIVRRIIISKPSSNNVFDPLVVADV